MRNKLMAVVLSCLTFLTLFVSALVPMQASAVSVDEMTRAAVSIITSNEGTYGSVNRNDCGAVSVGMLQWHANRALQLMRSIAEADPASAQSILGGALYQEVTTASDWSYRTFSVSEGSAASALLSSATGVAKQDALAYNDVQGYINSGMNYGLTNAGVLVYYADLYNRGSGIAAQLLNIAKGSGSYGDITLSTLHNTALANSSSYYTTRLNNAYNTIVSYGWGDSSASGGNGGSTTPDTSDFSESYAGTYVVTASALNVRSTPSTSGSKVGEIPNGASVAVSSANGSWAAVSYQGITGYCSMDYLQLKAADTTAPAETTTAAETTTTTAAAPSTDGFSERYAGSYQVTASVLNMRSAPSVSASKVGSIPNGTIVTVTAANGSWAAVSYQGTDGYCSMDYLQLKEAATTTVTTTGTTAEETTTETEAVTTTAAPETTAGETTTEVTVQTDVTTSDISDPTFATLYGDVNCDGKVSAADAVLLQKYLNGSVYLNCAQLANADCQRDGMLDSTDITVILQYLIDNLLDLPIV